MKKYNFDEIIDRHGTDCLKYDFAVRRGRPADVLPMWVADMDFRVPDCIQEALTQRVNHGIYGYTDMGDEYNEAVCSWFEKRHGWRPDPEWIVKTPGVVTALALAVRALTEPGDAVLIQQPVYYPFSGVIEANGRRVISSDLVLAGECGPYATDFDDFERKIEENGIHLFILCSPHNPVGRVWKKDELRQIADICERHDVKVVSDEIHCDLLLGDSVHTPFVTVSDYARDNSIVCTAPSKTFNIAGLQASNIFIPNEEIREKFKAEMSCFGYGGLSVMAFAAAKAAYEGGMEWHIQVMEYIENNLDWLRNYLTENLPEIKLIEPEGTYLIWLDCRELGMNAEELEDFMLNKAKLWLDEGAIFGRAGAGFERINIACPRSTLEEAMDRLAKAVGQL